MSVALRTEPERARRGSALLAVFVFVIAALMLASTLLSLSRVGLRTTAASLESTEARQLAGSAALAYLSQLEDQRLDLIRGMRPELDGSITLYEMPDGRRAVARLLPVGDELATSENAKLDVNQASEEALAQIGLIGEGLAAAIVAAREESPFMSLADLLTVEGITGELLYGDTDTVLAELDPGGALIVSEILPSGAPAGEPDADRLSDVLTVFGFDPNVMAGVSGEPDDEGAQRVNLNQPWSDELRDPIERRYGAEVAGAMERLMSSDRVTFDDTSDIVTLLGRFNVDVESWPEVLDVFSTSADPFLAGRIDIMRARPEVLASLPGMTRELVEAVISERESLDSDESLTPVWLVERGVLSQSVFGGLIDLITTRSTQWRVRIEIGIETDDGQSGARTGDLTAVDLTHRTVLDVVYDAAAPRVRIAELVDVTFLTEALHLAGVPDGQTDGAFRGTDPETAEAYERLLAGEDTDDLLASGVDLIDIDSAADRADVRRARLEAERDARRPTMPERTAPGVRADGRDSGTASGDTGDDEAVGQRPPPPAGVDRRLGRWTRPSR